MKIEIGRGHAIGGAALLLASLLPGPAAAETDRLAAGVILFDGVIAQYEDERARPVSEEVRRLAPVETRRWTGLLAQLGRAVEDYRTARAEVERSIGPLRTVRVTDLNRLGHSLDFGLRRCHKLHDELLRIAARRRESQKAWVWPPRLSAGQRFFAEPLR